MKYVIWVLIIGAGYYQYEKSQLWSHENVLQSFVEKRDEYCSNQEMLNHYGISKNKCMNVYSFSILSCAQKLETKYPGDMFDSQEEASEAAGYIGNCINSNLKG